MIEVVLYYLFSVAAVVAAVVGGFIWFKKKKLSVQWSSLILGILVSVVYFIVLFVLFFSTFNRTSEQYFNTAGFRVLIGFVYVFLLSIARALILRAALFEREKREQGISLAFGFGVGPALLFGIYLLMMAVVILYNGIANSPAVWNADGYLLFADNTIIGMVFPTPSAHLFVTLALICYIALNLANAWFYKRISEQVIAPWVVVSLAITLALLETAAILPIPFIGMDAYWGLSIIGAIISAAAIILVRLLPKEKQDSNYMKQFE